jgi:hypothetical protein
VTAPHGRSSNRRHKRQFFYKYVAAETAKKILTTRKLRWSSPVLFNDPFDVTKDLRLNFDVAELNAALVEETADLIASAGPVGDTAHPGLKALMAVLSGMSQSKRQQIADNVRNDPFEKTARQMDALAQLRERWSVMVPKLRLLCMSEAPDVTPMWDRYADSYRGAVLQFEAIDELDSVWLVARPVVYQSEPPAIADARTWARCILRKGHQTYNDLFTEYQYTKTPDWAYEREWRIASFSPEESGQLSYRGFDPRELVGVYLGPRCLEQDQADILALLTDGLAHVATFRAQINVTAGKFTFEPIPKPS